MGKSTVYFNDGVSKLEEQDNGLSLATRILPATSGFTCNLSAINGNAFITNPSIVLTPYIGKKITLTAGGKTLVGWIKSAGTGETTTELITVAADRTFSSNTGFWTLSAAEISISGGKANWANSDVEQGLDHASITTVGVLYKGIMTISNFSAGSVRWVAGSYATANGSNATFTDYVTSSHANLHILAHANPTTLKVDDVSFSSVDTPSFTGVRITSTKGGTTYNWASDDGISYNAASYTVTISVA
jgi:flagellar hook-associated protein FlgK